MYGVVQGSHCRRWAGVRGNLEQCTDAIGGLADCHQGSTEQVQAAAPLLKTVSMKGTHGDSGVCRPIDMGSGVHVVLG